MRSAPPLAGSVALVGNFLIVSFPHDLRVAHAARQAGGQRVAIGEWRVPVDRATDLARRLAPLGLNWEGEASRFLTEEANRAAEWVVEQRVAANVKRGQFELVAEPPIDLLDHQRLGAQFLASRSAALLADEQGLGKTVTCLAAYWLIRQVQPEVRLIVICPNSLKHNWKSEVSQFFPEWSVELIGGTASSRRKGYGIRADIYVTNYESVRSDKSEIRLLLRRRPAIVVCDEAHALKNPDAQTTRAVSFLRSAAARMWLMTGTPVPNKVVDIYSQVSIADEGRTLGSIHSFKARYGLAAEDTAQLADLQQMIDPLILRRTKDEVLNLPDRTFESRWVELEGPQRTMYEEVRDGIRTSVSAMSEEEYEARQQNVLVRLLRLSQIASNPKLVDPEFIGSIAKQQDIDDLLSQLIEENHRKVVLWSYYVGTITEMIKRYRKYQPVAVYGAVGVAERAEAVRRFQEEDDVMLFIGNPQAAGTGLTLTSAQYAIYETLTWRYDLYAQSLDRIHRIGQQQNVTYFEVMATGTIDEAIRQRLEEKKVFAGNLLGDPQSLPPLTRDEVLAILD